MIRFADASDFPRVLELTKEFNEHYFWVPLNEHKFEAWFDQHMNAGLVLMSDTGFVSALTVVDPVRDWTVLVETGWYDTGRQGLRLMHRLVKEFRAGDYNELRVCTMSTSTVGLDNLLTRLGFTLDVERSHSLMK